MNKAVLILLTCVMFVTLLLAAATPPALVNYQGVLRDGTGAPQAGSFDMVFRFYNLVTAGTLLLTDTHNAAAPSGQVAVANGLFTAQLGAGTLTAGSEPNLAEVFRDNAAVWLEIQVGTETLAPRIRVLASAYAQNAATLQGSVNVDAWGGVEIVKASDGGNLTVASPGIVEVNLENNSDTPGTFNAINFWHVNDGRAALASYVPGDGDVDLLFLTTDAGTEGLAMALTGNGNLGIGTIAPDWRLDVSGDARVSGAFRDSSADAGTSGQVLQSTGTGTNWVSPSTLNDGDWTISGSNLYSAVSGNVGIGTQAPTAKLQVIGPLEVQTYSDETLDQSQTSHVGHYGGTINWQSFTAGITGKLTRVEFYSRSPLTSGSPVAATLDIRAGQGTGGALLASQSFLITQDVYVWQSIPFSAPPDVVLGSQYTLIFKVASVDRQWWRENNTNPYSEGEGSPGSWCDFAFNTYCSTQIGPTLYSAINGRVGIGTTTPTSMLDVVGDTRVSGAFRDSSGDPGSSGQVLSSTAAGTNWVSPSTLSDGDWTISGSNMYSAVSGNVGIGTDAPAYNLEVSSTGTPVLAIQTSANGGQDAILRIMGSRDASTSDNIASIQLHNDNAAGTPFEGARIAMRNSDSNISTSNADLVFLTNNGSTLTEKMRIKDNGHVGIGTNAPAAELHVLGSGWFGLDSGSLGTAAGKGIRVWTESSSSLGRIYAYDYGASSALNLSLQQPGGYVGIGNITPSYQLHLATDSAAKPSTSTWTIASDRRLKKDIAAFADGLEVIRGIEPIRYRYNGLAETPKDREGIGVIAQEIQEVAPYTVGKFKAKMDDTAESETELYNFNAHALTFVMINAIKELDERTKGLEGKDGAKSGARSLNMEPNSPDGKRALKTAGTAAGPEPSPTGTYGPAVQMLPGVTGIEPGDVLVLNPANGDELYPCNLPADPMVVGIALEESETSDVRREMEGRDLSPLTSYFSLVVVGGVTFVKADATLAPIAKGDLLVASGTPGHAMRAQPTMVNGFPMHQSGTLIGKALEDLPAGTGMIRVLVMLR